MAMRSARRAQASERAPIRSGRPPKEMAGEVEGRILDAAARVFRERGFEGASVDEIAEMARAGKPTIYARFSGKEALFAAVILRMVQRSARFENVLSAGHTAQERLAAVAKVIIERALAPENVGLMRSAIGAAARFPELASRVHRDVRERGKEAVAEALAEFARLDEMDALPAFSPTRLSATARRFVDLILLPMVLRALFGEDPDALRAEADVHIAQAVAFFLAACRNETAGGT